MDKSATQPPLVRAAYAFYEWFNGAPIDPGGIAVIHDFLGPAITLEGLYRLEKRLRDNPSFFQRHASIVSRWRERMESARPLSEQEAQQLMQELFDGFDHALLYDHGVTAGCTRALRGRLNNSDKTFSGGMPCWTLHFTVAGSALFISDSMEQEIHPGDLMLLKPEARYHYGLHPRADEWEHLWALFQPRQHWPELLQWPSPDAGILHLSVHDDSGRALLETLFRGIIAMRDDASPYRSDLQYNRLEEILIRACEMSRDLTESRVDPRVQQACKFMQARLSSRILIDDVASFCNLSPSRFAHLFKEHMGCGPKSWINDMRLQKARKLLVASEDSINIIGSRVGFEDPSHFTRYFKQNMGCSPREFRQSFSVSAADAPAPLQG